ncbi:MAG TPA: primase-helicase family protein [Arachidicoccus sp.]|nr:primase-helicase family protein [Arachidicoccus sp.]
MEAKTRKSGEARSGKEYVYYRIGTQYFKEVMQPLISGDESKRLVPWSVEAIKLDHGKDFFENEVKKLDGFCLIPGHMDYQRIFQKFYNRYHPFSHAASRGKEPVRTLLFLNHIFGSQLKLGIDYLKLLLLKPVQQLPILCLVSSERATGKSTFLNWLKAIYGENMTINSNENFQSAFNADWVTKLIIAVEDALLNKREDSERFKNLSTAKYSKLESKGVDRMEIEFFGKFILCSNNEDNFIYVDKQEVRYWVRKIPVLESCETDILAKLEEEISCFLSFLLEQPFSTEKKTRMWFTPKEIYTPALGRLKAANQNKLENELAQAAITIIDNMEDDSGVLQFCLSDAQSLLKSRGIRSNDSLAIKRILQNEWGLKPQSNSIRYTKWQFSSDGTIYFTQGKGRYYTLTKKLLENLHFSDALMPVM